MEIELGKSSGTDELAETLTCVRHLTSHIKASGREGLESTLSLAEFLRSMVSVIKLTRKSDREEFFLYLKLVLLGLGVVGVIGFFVKLISTALPTIFG